MLVAKVPPLRGRRAADGAEEKAGHSGRDDSVRKRKRKKNPHSPGSFLQGTNNKSNSAKYDQGSLPAGSRRYP
jgi:hypothetical protein